MDEFNYLLNCDEETILNTWNALGSVTVNNNTKVYTKGSVVRINASKDGSELSKATLHNNIVYVCEDYRVDNVSKFDINWEELSIDDVKGIHAAVQGVQLPYFGILPAKYSAAFIPDNKFIPYDDKENKVVNDTGGINISEDELSTILTVIGLPLVDFDDLEYSKSQIIKFMIKPAMQRYFTYRPIIKEQGYGQIASGSEFLAEFPEGAHGCVPYYCVPGGGNPAAGNTGSPFAYFNELMFAGAGTSGSRYGRGLKYVGKQVPGYVNLNWQSGFLDQMAANQGMLNYFRREKYSKVKINGKLYARGFSTVGGNLNFKWLFDSKDWDDVNFEDLETIARPMARSEVLKNFVLIRTMVKTDIAGQLDASEFKSERERIETELGPIIKSIGITGILAVSR